MKKWEINEIIDGDDNIMGDKTEPESSPNKETQANKTTDYNAKVHGQNFKNDFLGRFGFYFYESEEDINVVKEKLAKLFYGKFLQSLDYYKKHPNVLGYDHNTHLGDDDINFNNMNEVDYEWAEEALKILDPFLKGQIDEASVAEDKIVDKNKKKALKKDKDDDRELNAKVKRVADLIEKLPEKDKKEVKKILEQ